MKTSKLNLLAFLAVTLFFGSLQLYAQQDINTQQKSNKIIIIKKYIDENGVETIERIVKESDGENDINTLFDSDELGEDIRDLDIDINELDDQIRINIQSGDEDGQPTIFKWNGKGDLPDNIQEELNQKGMSFNFNFDDDDDNDDERRSYRNFKSCNTKKKAFLGVVSHSSSDGLYIDEVVRGSAAEAAGIEEDDVITAIDGEEITSPHDLKGVLRNLQTGDVIMINYDRDGQSNQVSTTLKPRRSGRSSHSYNFSRSNSRNSCKPFIGVYLETGYDDDGVEVTDIIDATPAEKAGLLEGDIIKAIDGVDVKTHMQIRRQRDTHGAGDEFTITYERDGIVRKVDAQFLACDDKKDKVIILKKKQETEKQETEISPTPEPNLNTSPSLKQVKQENNTLRLKELQTFPNPTAGKLSLQFKAEAIPTVLRITDIMGREVFKQDLNNFDGTYNEELNLNEFASPGTLFINIIQKDKIFTEKIILSSPY